jgi:hypothetical protein
MGVIFSCRTNRRTPRNRLIAQTSMDFGPSPCGRWCFTKPSPRCFVAALSASTSFRHFGIFDHTDHRDRSRHGRIQFRRLRCPSRPRDFSRAYSRAFRDLVVGVWILLPPELSSLAKNATAGALFSASLMLLSSGYFDLDANLKPLLQLWSLGVEEQFYLAWPLALWLTPRKWRTTLIGTTIVSSFMLSIALVNAHPEATFYLPFTRLWELIARAALTGISIRSEKHRETLAAIGAASSITPALVPVAGTSATILSAGSVLNRKLFSHPVAVFIGWISSRSTTGTGPYWSSSGPAYCGHCGRTKLSCW